MPAFKLTSPRVRPRQIELPIHKAILGYLRAVLPPGAVIHHSPNEFGMTGAEVERQIAKHKMMGMTVGWPDLEIMWCGRPYFLEVKAPKNDPSAAQIICHAALRAAGCEVAVVRSIEDVRDALQAWKIETREARP